MIHTSFDGSVNHPDFCLIRYRCDAAGWVFVDYEWDVFHGYIACVEAKGRL